MNELLDFLNNIEPEWVMVIATITYVYYTTRLFNETKKLREVETSPFIMVKLEPYNATSILKLEIVNIGKSPAYEVDILFDKKIKEIFEGKKYTLPETHINYLAVGQKISNLIGNIDELGKDIDEFVVHLKYKSKDKIDYKETIKINYKFMVDIGMLLDTPQSIKKLEDIKKEIAKLEQAIKMK